VVRVVACGTPYCPSVLVSVVGAVGRWPLLLADCCCSVADRSQITDTDTDHRWEGACACPPMGIYTPTNAQQATKLKMNTNKEERREKARTGEKGKGNERASVKRSGEVATDAMLRQPDQPAQAQPAPASSTRTGQEGGAHGSRHGEDEAQLGSAWRPARGARRVTDDRLAIKKPKLHGMLDAAPIDRGISSIHTRDITTAGKRCWCCRCDSPHALSSVARRCYRQAVGQAWRGRRRRR
jgi:hypothetical protein